MNKFIPVLLLLLLLAGCAKAETPSPLWSGVSARVDALDWSWRDAYVSDWEESPYLKQALLSSLALSRDGQLRRRDLEGVAYLMVIYDEPLDNLRYLNGLKTLNISYDARDEAQVDFSPISSLPKLQHLSMSNTRLEDLSFLQGMAELETLELDYANQVSDLSPLAGLTGLRWLTVDSCLVEDLSPLAELTGLEHLSLAHNQIDDLSPLAGLTNLAYLNLTNNQIRDVSPLAGLTGLTTLNLSRNEELADLSPLAGLSGLDSLSFNHCAVEDLSFLAELSALRYLHAERNRIVDIAPLLGLEKLDTVKLGENRISRGLEGADYKQIQSFQLEDNPLDYAPLAESILLPENLHDTSASGRFRLYAMNKNARGDYTTCYAHDAESGQILLVDPGLFHGELIFSHYGREHYQDPATGEKTNFELEVRYPEMNHPYWGRQYHQGLNQWVSLCASTTSEGMFQVNYHNQMGEYLYSVDTPFASTSDEELLGHRYSRLNRCALWDDWLIFYDFATYGEAWPGQRIAAYNVVTGETDYIDATFYQSDANRLVFISFAWDDEDNRTLVASLWEDSESRFSLTHPFGQGPLDSGQFTIQYNAYSNVLIFGGIELDFHAYMPRYLEDIANR